jgi:signal transduction histidine kinase
MPKQPRDPSFYWRGVLIVVPVLVLTVLGLISLRQDRVLAEAQARERAHELAEELAENVVTALKEHATSEDALAFEVDRSGELRFPPPLAPTGTVQPFVLTELPGPQATLWEKAQVQEWAGQGMEALSSYESFLKLQPPARYAAAAHFSRGVLLRKQGKTDVAAEEFSRVARDYPEALAESGVLFRVLAQLNWIELRTTQRSVRYAAIETLCSNVVSQPSAVSQQILQRLTALEPGVTNWQHRWTHNEQARKLYRAAQIKLSEAAGEGVARFPSFFWVLSAEVPVSGSPHVANEWLMVKHAKDTNSCRYACWPAMFRWADLKIATNSGSGRLWKREETRAVAVYVDSTKTFLDPLNRTVLEFAGKLPAYFDFSLELAGRPLVMSNYVPTAVKVGGAKGGGLHWEKTFAGAAPAVYGTASRYENGVEQLKAAIHLVSPQLLYERQGERALWFGMLIVATGAVAVFGYVSSLRAFQKQQRLAELKSNFVSSVSHELRAPIASVRLMAEGLERGTVHEPGKQAEYFRFIVQECRRLSSLIENVLDFARIEQGRKQYDFEPTDLPLVLYQTASVMKPYASEKQVELRVIANEAEFARLVSPPLVDGRAIQQALINLVDNAIKHSPAGSMVSVGLNVEEKRQRTGALQDAPRGSGAEELCIWVEDEGTGIPAAEHQKIFERFYRCGSELRRETQGVGIGLSIVKHIAEAHGGIVRVRSEVGQGSRFTIVIPVGGQANEMPQKAADASEQLTANERQ